MRTIFITIPWFTPAFKAGGPIRSIHNLVLALNQKFRFYIFTGDADVDGIIMQVPKDAWTDFAPNVWVWYDAEVSRSKNLTDEVEKIKPDVVFINGMFSWYFNAVPLLFVHQGHKILSVRGMLHTHALGQKKIKKQLYLRALHAARGFRQVTWHVVDEEEAAHIRKFAGAHAPLVVIPNVVAPLARSGTAIIKEGALKLLSIGLISRMKNYLLVLQALAQVKTPVSYTICGAIKDAGYWEACQAAAATLPPHITVKYAGAIAPEDVAAALAAAHVFVLPSRSENFGHAILEALTAGVPVITSQSVPWRGLQEAKAGINVEPNPKSIAVAIDFFADMPPEAHDLWRRGAADYIAAKSTNASAIEAYEKLFQGTGGE